MYSQTPSPLKRFEKWCAVLSIAARAPQIAVEEFAPYISLTNTERAIYDMVAVWAGRESTMIQAFAKNSPELIERIVSSRKGEVKSRVLKKLLVFAAEKIELEWPGELVASSQVGSVMDSAYFFC